MIDCAQKLPIKSTSMLRIMMNVTARFTRFQHWNINDRDYIKSVVFQAILSIILSVASDLSIPGSVTR